MTAKTEPTDFLEELLAASEGEVISDEETEVKVARKHGPRARECPRCSGMGFIQVYWHIDGGRCFKCGGSGRVA